MKMTGYETREVLSRYNIVTESDPREQSMKLKAHWERVQAAIHGKEQARNTGEVEDLEVAQAQD